MIILASGKIRLFKSWHLISLIRRKDYFEYSIDMAYRFFTAHNTSHQAYTEFNSLISTAESQLACKDVFGLNKSFLALEILANKNTVPLHEYEQQFEPPYLQQELILDEYRAIVLSDGFKYKYGSEKFRDHERNYFLFIKNTIELLGYSFPHRWQTCIDKNILILDVYFIKTGLENKKFIKIQEENWVDTKEINKENYKKEKEINKIILDTTEDLSGTNLMDTFSDT